MLDRNLIRTEPEFVKQRASVKNISAPVEQFLKVDEEYRSLKVQLDSQRNELNVVSKSIGGLFAQGKKEEAEVAKVSAKALSEAVAEGEVRERELDAALYELELQFPNLPHESVPVGDGEQDNVVIKTWGEKPEFTFQPKPHWEIADTLKLFDTGRAAKISGSGFMVYTGLGARLQRSLFNFMADWQTEERGYYEVYPPFIVNRDSLIGTGQLPKFEDDLYKVDDDLFLIPTAEVPVTNLYRDEILDVWQLPMKFAAYSGCFRREAGAAGKDTRGIQRMHQFDKVELVKYSLPETSYDELEAMLADAESVLQALGMHYRVTLLCGPEMSFSNAKCYDIEVWAPGVDKYLEISSVSNFEAFQARRANIRFKREQGAKPEFVHILNGSGLATPRLFASILEVFQQEDGTVVVPEPLRRYIGREVLEGVGRYGFSTNQPNATQP
ncbi:MAG: serine--tRNA ligase [Fimbriimonadaceae bacterium]|nr:serine--tRNA ligase [Fimbriimonadaceae bacterium]